VRICRSISVCWRRHGAPPAVAHLIDRYEAALPPGGWPNWVLGNHDQRRIAVRIGADQARIAAMLLLSLRGTPTLYYGDEIGMRQVPIPPDRVRDPFEKNVPGLGLGRDGCRTPMQWDASPPAGFSSVQPWLPLAEDAATCNVATQRSDFASLYNLYRRLIAFRRKSPALTGGSYRPLVAADDVLAYIREADGEQVLVALNFGGRGGCGAAFRCFRRDRPGLIGRRPRRSECKPFISPAGARRGRGRTWPRSGLRHLAAS
jgi:alpha-glucosidase